MNAMDQKPRTILAEFHKEAGGRLILFSVNVFEDGGDYYSRTIYDVDRSKKYGYLFDQSGAGGGRKVCVSGIYFLGGAVPVEVVEKPTNLVSAGDSPPWRSRETRVIRDRNRTRRLRQLPKEFRCDDGDLMNWLERNAIQQDGVWCSACRDWVPGDDLCDHSWWCDAVSWYSTPEDRKTCKRCINGRCREDFEIVQTVEESDGPLWFWGGEPELTWRAKMADR